MRYPRLHAHHIALLISLLFLVSVIVFVRLTRSSKRQETQQVTGISTKSENIVAEVKRRLAYPVPGKEDHDSIPSQASTTRTQPSVSYEPTLRKSPPKLPAADTSALDGDSGIQQKVPGAKPYPTFHSGNVDWPDTPENRALVARFDEILEYETNELEPLRSELRRIFDELMGVKPPRNSQGRLTDDARRLQISRQECLEYMKELQTLANTLRNERWEILDKLVASKKEFEGRYGE